jgi:3-oxoacyl-[acyl-carrier protein] reductase
LNIAFERKTVIVTGAGHGFGQRISIEFAQRGAQVWACDLSADELATTQQLAEQAAREAGSGGSCQVRAFDLTHRDAIFNFVSEAQALTGRVDVLVNNAGGVLGQVGQPLEDVTPAQWQAVFDVNVSAAFYLSQAVVPQMKHAQTGRIVNIASGAGLGVSLTGIQAYAAAKAALVNLTRQLAHELGAWDITVNCIAPGFVRSNPNTERQWQSYGEEGQQRIIEGIALKRLGTPQDIAYGVLFFASEYAGWITGQVLSIDGGK